MPDIAWTQFTAVEQTRFMQTAGLSELPAPAALNAAQWSVLTGIVGESRAESFRLTYAPDTVAAPALAAPTFNTGDWASIMAMIAELQAKSSEMQMKAASEGIQATKESVAKANAEKLAKLRESIEKMESTNVLEIVGKVLGWAGAILALAGAVVATIATKGAAFPLIILAVAGIGLMVATETGLMEKAMNFILDHPVMLLVILGPVAGGALFAHLENGVIEEEHAKMIMQVAIMLAMLAASIVGAIASGGASAADTVLKVIGIVGQLTGGIIQIASGSVGIAQAAVSYEAGQVQADAKELTAWLAKLQALLGEQSEFLQEIMDKLNAGMVDASDILSDIAGSHQSVISNMGV